MKMGKYETAEMAFRRASFLGKHSVHNSSSIHINHLKSFLGLAETSSLQPKQLENFHLSIIKDSETVYKRPRNKSSSVSSRS